MPMILNLLVLLILVGLAFWTARMIAGAFGIPAPIVTVIQVVLVIVVVLYLVSWIGAGPRLPVLRIR